MKDVNELSNNLQHETSPYLLQHAENPVNWYPWGEAAFSRAKEEDGKVCTPEPCKFNIGAESRLTGIFR